MNRKAARRRLMQRDGDRCAWCRTALHGHGTIDHIVPAARGGTNDDPNLVLACRDCNGEKGDRFPRDPVWIAYYGWRRLVVIEHRRQKAARSSVPAPPSAVRHLYGCICSACRPTQ